MNEHLRKFEKESGLEIYGLGAKRDRWEAALEKYAELIVKKCAMVGNYAYDGGEYPGAMIKEYFGVEE